MNKSNRYGLLAAFLVSGAVGATETWDGLPAMEPVHLKGLYAGRSVCPMCAHGYDAGLMVFVPDTLPVEHARALAANTKPQALGITSDRYRVFIVVTGRPSPALVQALTVDDPRWFVASLRDEALVKAEKEIGQPLGRELEAFSFAQRRLLHVMKGDALRGKDVGELHAQSQYAMQVLDALFPVNISKEPQGAMWTAPSVLQEKMEFGAGANLAGSDACFTTEKKSQVANSMVRVDTVEQGKTASRWARTDSDGCIRITGFASPVSVPVSIYSNLKPVLRASLRADSLRLPRPTIVVGAAVSATPGNERVVGLPCEGCEDVLVGMSAEVSSRERIAPLGEPGEPLRVQGTVVNSEGKPVSGVILMAYQTDRTGVYFRSDGNSTTRIRLRGWVKSDVNGQYTFDTIRPGSYPSRESPAHIHMHVVEVGRCTYYIDNIVFSDDPLLDKSHASKPPRAGSGVTTPVKNSQDMWQVTRDIHLGRNVPQYELCDAKKT